MLKLIWSKEQPRQICVVPGCKHTRTPTDHYLEWICQQHWSATNSKRRRKYFIARRQGRQNLAFWLWKKLRTEAIERAVGL